MPILDWKGLTINKTSVRKQEIKGKVENNCWLKGRKVWQNKRQNRETEGIHVKCTDRHCRDQGEKVSVFSGGVYSRGKSRAFTGGYKNLTGAYTDCTVNGFKAERWGCKQQGKTVTHTLATHILLKEKISDTDENLPTTLPTMPLDHRQLVQRFGCVCLTLEALGYITASTRRANKNVFFSHFLGVRPNTSNNF